MKIVKEEYNACYKMISDQTVNVEKGEELDFDPD